MQTWDSRHSNVWMPGFKATSKLTSRVQVLMMRVPWSVCTMAESVTSGMAMVESISTRTIISVAVMNAEAGRPAASSTLQRTNLARPSPERGYNQILCPKGIHNHFPAFRNYREYAGGALADMGAHHFDIAQWALGMDNSGPVKIEPPEGNAGTGLKFTYANGIVMTHGGRSGCTFEGTKGTLYVDRGKIESDPANILEAKLGADDFHVEPSDNHHRNWIDAIRSRKKPICDVEIGHRSATVCQLGQIGYDLRRTLNWDPVKERFVNDDDANKLLSRPMRDPWKL